MEFLIERIRRRFTTYGLQILFISAVVPNSEEIATWLIQGKPIVVNSEWKPTKLRQAIFFWDRDWRGRLRYPEERLVIITDVERRIIQNFHKITGRPINPKYSPEGSNEIAIELALKFIKASPIIIFTAIRTHIKSIAEKLLLQIQNQPIINGDSHHTLQLEFLAQRIESKLGKGFPLANYVREGFAYHHGLLPDDVKQDIEESFRRGHLLILISTTTLAHGMNLPVRLMIVANLNRGGSTPFPVRDFRNIAGRSGRALEETEGQVIFVQNTQSEWLVEEQYKYLRDDRIEKVQSVLFELYKQILQNRLGMSATDFQFSVDFEDFTVDFSDADVSPQTELERSFQTQIIAMLYEKLLEDVDSESIRDMLGQMLFGHQRKIDWTYYAPLVDLTEKQVKYITDQFKSETQKRAFYRTGLSLRSCQNLEEQVKNLANQNVFSQIRDPINNSLNQNFLLEILKLAASVEETKPTRNYTGRIELAIEALWSWINYTDISSLVQQFKARENFFQDPLNVSDLVYKYFVNNIPWALNSIIKILQYLQDDEDIMFDPEIRLLPAYAKYGVNTPTAAYIGGMGIFERNVIQKLSDLYLENTGDFYPSFESFQTWAESRTYEDLLPVLERPEIVSEVLARFRHYQPHLRPTDHFANPSTINFITYVVGLGYENRAENLIKVQHGESLLLLREANNQFDPYAVAVYKNSNVQLGYIRRNIAFILSTLYDEGLRFNCQVMRINSSPNQDMNRRLLVRITPGKLG